MSISQKPASRVIIVGAGASIPYKLPLAWELLKSASERVASLRRRAQKGIDENYRVNDSYVANGDDLNRAIMRAMGGVEQLDGVARAFRELLVAQNLDDFVRDHPSLTNVVSMLITVTLFQKIYSASDGVWQLRSQFEKGGLTPDKDWMRSLVGIIRATSSADQKVAVVSFNYDGLLERSMRMYWGGAERKYPPLKECVEFVYPHGVITELPAMVTRSVPYLEEQANSIRLGDNKDDAARERAKALVAQAEKIYSVGFSFSADNRALLGITQSRLRQSFFVQNFEYADKRLTRLLDEAQASPKYRDDGDMDQLIKRGFFEL